MAILTPLWTHRTYKTDADIAAFLADHPIAGGHIVFERWKVPERLYPLTSKPTLTDDEKRAVLDLYQPELARLRDERGYVTADLVVLHPDVPDLDKALGKFDLEHHHADDEVRYIVDGRGVFGFCGNDGRRFLLEVRTGEFLNVPANSWHWFYLTDERRIKAIRIFKDPAGWVAHYRPLPAVEAF
jgi:1,2-dihydroxy-3-keto-5-methylthiopentene dioxygenase